MEVLNIESIVDSIIKSREKGFRDDFIMEGLLKKKHSEDVIDAAFKRAGQKYDKSKKYATFIFEPYEINAIKKKAKKDGLKIDAEINKILMGGLGIKH
jgi:hypothetical protein